MNALSHKILYLLSVIVCVFCFVSINRQFAARSKLIHDAASKTLVADYHYSSLEDARQIIKKYKGSVETSTGI